MSKEIINIKSKKGIVEFLKQPTIKIAEFLTGFLSSDANDYKLSGGHLVQAVLKRNLFTQLGREINKYVKEGKIKEDYFATNLNQQTLSELLKFIDTEVPDEERFKAIKSIFFASVSKDSAENDEILAYEFIKICKDLSSMEILILSANYAVVNNTGRSLTRGIEWGSNRGVSYWAQIISEKTGHNLPEFVLQFENHLMNLQLISLRQFMQNNTELTNYFMPTPYFRLTPLGYKLCEFMTKYE